MAKGKIKISQRMVIIGGSAGSFEVLMQILPRLKQLDFAIIIVLHRKSSTDMMLTELLRGKTILQVKEVEEKEFPLPGYIYTVPGDYHLLLEPDHSFTLDYSEKVHYCRPAIDIVFQSAADVYQQHLACILLSGANADGTDGLRYVRQKGGITMAQKPSESNMAYMPEQAIQNNVVDRIMDIDGMVEFINHY